MPKNNKKRGKIALFIRHFSCLNNKIIAIYGTDDTRGIQQL